MNSQEGTSFRFMQYIEVQNEEQLSYWAQKFSISLQELKKIIGFAGPVIKDIHDYLQSLKPVHISYKPKEYIVAQYQKFVQQKLKDYKEDFSVYGTLQQQENFSSRYWPILMNEVVEEADRLVDHYGITTEEKLHLLSVLKKVAEPILLNVNEQ